MISKFRNVSLRLSKFEFLLLIILNLFSQLVRNSVILLSMLLMLFLQSFYFTFFQLEQSGRFELYEEPESNVWHSLLHLLSQVLKISEQFARPFCLDFVESREPVHYFHADTLIHSVQLEKVSDHQGDYVPEEPRFSTELLPLHYFPEHEDDILEAFVSEVEHVSIHLLQNVSHFFGRKHE